MNHKTDNSSTLRKSDVSPPAKVAKKPSAWDFDDEKRKEEYKYKNVSQDEVHHELLQYYRLERLPDARNYINIIAHAAKTTSNDFKCISRHARKTKKIFRVLEKCKIGVLKG